MKIKLDGLKELQNALEQRFDTTQNEVVLQKGAEYLKERLEDSVYDYGLKKRTGKSEQSMAIEVSKMGNEVYVGVSNQRSDAFYLYFHEFGTSKFRARPFVRPTFENHMQNIIDEMAKEMKARLRL